MACAAQRGVDTVGDDGLLEVAEVVVRHEMVGEAHGDRVGSAERSACQRGVQAQ